MKIIVLLASAGCAGCNNGGAAEDAHRNDPAIPVVVAAAEQRPIPMSVSALGIVESIGTVQVQTRVDGEIVRVFVKDGAEVKAGQPLFQIDPKPFEIQLRMAQATLARDAATLRNAQAKSDRGQMLFAQHFISNDEYMQLKSNLDSAAATTEQDRAQVDNAKLQLGYTTIRAAVSGKIGHIAQQVGNTVHAAGQTSLTTLNVLDSVDVSFAIPEQQLAAVREALQAAPIEVSVTQQSEAISPSGGVLTFIDNTADPTTGTIRLRARFTNRSRVLWPGQFVSVAMTLNSGSSGVVVPSTAIAEGPQGSYVYIVTNDGIAELRAVQIQRGTDTLTMITGVKPGEQVVVDGQSKLGPNAKVTVRSGQAS
jgi:multidrug efflux system membrane fusion protein